MLRYSAGTTTCVAKNTMTFGARQVYIKGESYEILEDIKILCILGLILHCVQDNICVRPRLERLMQILTSWIPRRNNLIYIAQKQLHIDCIETISYMYIAQKQWHKHCIETISYTLHRDNFIDIAQKQLKQIIVIIMFRFLLNTETEKLYIN